MKMTSLTPLKTLMRRTLWSKKNLSPLNRNSPFILPVVRKRSKLSSKRKPSTKSSKSLKANMNLVLLRNPIKNTRMWKFRLKLRSSLFKKFKIIHSNTLSNLSIPNISRTDLANSLNLQTIQTHP